MKKACFSLFLFASLFVCAFVAADEEKQSIQIQLPDKSIIKAEVAKTTKDRAKGLMFRQELPKDSGMLFVLNEDEEAEFWMKNTFVDLDILFIDSHKIIKSIFEKVHAASIGMQDKDIQTVRAKGKYVLELPSGTVLEHSLRLGDALLFSLEQDN